jgi:hypothetical protein
MKVMKKSFFFLISLLFLFGGVIVGQTQRLVLAEEFTNASCVPCANQNPQFDALLQQNTDKITSIKYHMSWPGADPMYNHNTVDNNARRAVYGITGVPHVQMDGNWWDGMPSQVNQARINAAYSIPSSFKIKVHHELSADQQYINVVAMVEATEDVSVSDLRLFLVVIEKHIHFTSPPGYNGEKDFYNVMKKILPDKNGYKLKSNISNGEYFVIESSWKLANVYNNSQLSVVAFIQDMATKEVYQAANSSEDLINPPYANDIEIFKVNYVTHKNCSGKMSPVAVIRNNGSQTVTSMEIKYHINDNEIMTYNWTGSLGLFEKTEIPFDNLSFDVQDENMFVIDAVSVNGTTDEYPVNNLSEIEFYRADVVDVAYLLLYLDSNPEQTTWKLMKSSGEVVQEGGPYTNPDEVKVIPLEFSGSDCYRLEMLDSGNDGFTGGGFYMVVLPNNDILFQGKDFCDKDVNELSYGVVSMDETTALSNFSLYPNPAASDINISFLLKERENIEIEIYDMQGKFIKGLNKGEKNVGDVNLNIDVTDMQSGMYILRLKAGDETFVHKFSIR